MRALVTGGAGFIGSNLVDALLDRGDEVDVVDDLSTGRHENLERALARGASFHEADITDAGRMRSLFGAARPDIVFTSPRRSMCASRSRTRRWDAGINVGARSTSWRRRAPCGVKRVVNTSTGGAIYGETDSHAHARERHAPADGGLRAEQVLRRGLLRLVRAPVRPLVGDAALRQRVRPAPGPARRGGVIAIFCGKLLAGERPLIFGDGRQTRDYVYVGDIVAANLAAAAPPEAHGAYNVGTGTEASVLEVLAAMRTAAGLARASSSPSSRRRGRASVQRSSLDVTRARAELGFTADTDLVTGMKRDARVGAIGRLGGVAAGRLGCGVARRGDGLGVATGPVERLGSDSAVLLVAARALLQLAPHHHAPADGDRDGGHLDHRTAHRLGALGDAVGLCALLGRTGTGGGDPHEVHTFAVLLAMSSARCLRERRFLRTGSRAMPSRYRPARSRTIDL
jgi:UDP-glucose 4-epimerase